MGGHDGLGEVGIHEIRLRLGGDGVEGLSDDEEVEWVCEREHVQGVKGSKDIERLEGWKDDDAIIYRDGL